MFVGKTPAESATDDINLINRRQHFGFAVDP